MGVPKLFKYLTERYPSLAGHVAANQLPQYDFFYIDLNNLIHKALSDKGLLPLEQFDAEFHTEERIFERVLRYIETLHRIIPSKVLFLSIDGVAPRAKWHTQRERRLRAVNKDGATFDSNAISPGTIFMNKFETVLINFISNKIKFHSNWQNCEIYVSGSNCPGEGSVKIFDFIRSLKKSKDYNPNATHCIYSGDNDCLLLGIAVHEVYISLIQERKKCPSSLASLCSDDTKHVFEVIHFEMLRQYLRMEFLDCQTEMSFEFKMDNIVDDWVLLISLFGNDYVPELPNFNFENDALSIIYDAYKEVLKTSRGYINDCGFLDVRRFGRLIKTLKSKDFDLYCNSVKSGIDQINGDLTATHLNNNNHESKSLNEMEPSVSNFLEMKDVYYTEKLGGPKIPDYTDMSLMYVKTIQWIMFYYFRGFCSWSHYYPYGCVPFVGDFTPVHNVTFTMDIDKPVKPFTHLLAILPKNSGHLLPKSYELMMIGDNLKDDLFRESKVAENHLNADDKERNTEKPMLKLKYVKSDKISDCLKVSEIFATKQENDRIDTAKDIHRPFNRDDFNFKFSTLNLLDYTSKLVHPNVPKSQQQLIVCLKADQPNDIEVIANNLINQTVYVNWPRFVEAKVIQVFDATHKYDGSSGEIKAMPNSLDFDACVEELNARYSKYGIDVGEIKIIAYVTRLKCIEYKISEPKSCAYEMTKKWHENKWEPVAFQTLVKGFMPDRMPILRPVKDELSVKNVFLMGNKSYYYGEMATIHDIQQLETTGRVNILCYMDQEPDFKRAIEAHTAVKTSKLNEFKQPSTTASLLGISEKVLARITGAVLVSSGDSTDIRNKINIGLQLKIRSVYKMNVICLDEYIQSNGKQFLYSQLAIDLVQQYIEKFPRVFELLSASETGMLFISEFDENNNNQQALEYVAKITTWLKESPHSKIARKPMNSMQLSNDAIKYVQEAVMASYESDATILRLKMKWQNLYIPDLNNVFIVPCPDASYKLLDRIVIVRSGYPIPIGAKGTIIGIEPTHNHITGDITDTELYALDILMDTPFEIRSSSGKFKRHQTFRTRTTNMLINISHGRAN